MLKFRFWILNFWSSEFQMYAANGLYVVRGELSALISSLKRDHNSYQVSCTNLTKVSLPSFVLNVRLLCMPFKILTSGKTMRILNICFCFKRFKPWRHTFRVLLDKYQYQSKSRLDIIEYCSMIINPCFSLFGFNYYFQIFN